MVLAPDNIFVAPPWVPRWTELSPLVAQTLGRLAFMSRYVWSIYRSMSGKLFLYTFSGLGFSRRDSVEKLRRGHMHVAQQQALMHQDCCTGPGAGQ